MTELQKEIQRLERLTGFENTNGLPDEKWLIMLQVLADEDGEIRNQVLAEANAKAEKKGRPVF